MNTVTLESTSLTGGRRITATQAGGHFLLVKRDGYDRQGRSLSPMESARMLLDAKCWPLWSHTKNRLAIRAGDRVAVYLSGEKVPQVIAAATVAEVSKWSRSLEQSYPLTADGVPFSALILKDVRVFEKPVLVRECLSRLSFIKPGVKKWGTAFMSVRSLNATDFATLTQ